VLGFMLFVGRYQICEGNRPWDIHNDERASRQLLDGVVGMIAGMSGGSCSKSASLSTSMAFRTSATWE